MPTLSSIEYPGAEGRYLRLLTSKATQKVYGSRKVHEHTKVSRVEPFLQMTNSLLGSRKTADRAKRIESMVDTFQRPECCMSVKIHLLFSNMEKIL